MIQLWIKSLGVVEGHITPKLAYRSKVGLSYQLSPETWLLLWLLPLHFQEDMVSTVCTCFFGTLNSLHSVDSLTLTIITSPYCLTTWYKPPPGLSTFLLSSMSLCFTYAPIFSL
ncbi:P44/Msp2 family outer membrane protein [Anaplasma phagocytophilum]|uniref:P44/Msp2 family outer membrane protein n=1 Tax=Anaplasma phagocytophilum TaxID=948 RepID=UPI0039779F5C